MRVQLALNVKDLEASIDFYSRLFGVTVNKRKPGYANFVINTPPMKLVLFEAPEGEDRLNHLGFEVADSAAVDAAAAHLEAAGLNPEIQEEEVCCFAKQNKAIAYAPDGTMWEWYQVLEDSETFFAEPKQTSCC